MRRYIIDANLPYYFSMWRGSEYIYVKDIDDEWTDSELWAFAKEHGLTIVTKDTDFSDRVLLSQPPPRVIHVKLGNLKMNAFHQAIGAEWADACELSLQYKLVQIFPDRIEGID